MLMRPINQNYLFPITFSIITDKHFLLLLFSYVMFTMFTVFIVLLHSYYLSYPRIRAKLFSFPHLGYQMKPGIKLSHVKGHDDTELAESGCIDHWHLNSHSEVEKRRGFPETIPPANSTLINNNN